LKLRCESGNRNMRHLSLGFVSIALVLCACGTPDRALDDAAKASTPTAAASTPETSTSTADPTAEARGIIVLTGTNDSCTVNAVDPLSGKLSVISTFEISPMEANCRDAEYVEPLVYSSTFDRLAFTSGTGEETHAGWMTNEGAFVIVGPDSSTPEFGESTKVESIGFDKLDNFYYTVDFGRQLEDSAPTEYYRVPAGDSGNGELIGTSDGESRFGRLPGGLLGFGATESGGCVLGVSWSSDFNPDIQQYYHTEDNQVIRSDQWCTHDGTPITPEAKSAVLNVAVSPTGDEVAFQTNLSDFYVTSASGAGTPRKLDVAELKDLGGTGWVIHSWR